MACCVAVSMLVACAGPSPIGADTDAAGGWGLVSGTLRGESIPIAPGYRITLTIKGDSVGGRAACNWYWQTISIEGTRSPSGRAAQRRSDANQTSWRPRRPTSPRSGARTGLPGTGDALVVSGAESSLRFERLIPVPRDALVDTVWVLDRLIDGDASVPAGGEPATLELRADGTFTGSTGCRELTGTFVIRSDEILATRMSADGHCPPDLAEQDAHVVGVLGDGFTVAIEADGLTATAMGSLGLSYRSA